MTEVESAIVIDIDENESTTKEICDAPPLKKFKQGRLPFKPLDHSSQKPPSSTPPGSKKRKLSDNESPSAKQPKIGRGSQPVKPALSDCDPEVSSSSEAEVVVSGGHQKGAKKLNTLDRFLKPKVETRDPEITSTNECVAIDLTDCDTGKNGLTLNSEEKENIEAETIEEGHEKGVEKTKIADKDSKEPRKDKQEGHEDQEDKKAFKKSKESVENTKTKSDLNDSFISDTSVCEAALKTPVKTTGITSAAKTPVPVDAKSVATSSQESDSDGTPASGRKIKKLSDSKQKSEKKKKEREEERLRKKAEKETELEEKRKQKEKEKEQKEKEKAEKKKQKEAEKAEKERQKQEEKEKKEKERLEKLQQKEEEKKLKEKEQEAKAEEKKKKEEEKRQKDEEKRLKEEEKKREEEEKVRKAEKKKEMFKGFFIQKPVSDSPPKTKESKNSFFMPFEVKPNMRLAPDERREPLTDEGKQLLDDCMNKQESSNLYLENIKAESFTPRSSVKTWPRKHEDDNDLEILSHEKETIEKVTYHAKFLYFHENTRPPYYGTWRKRSAKLTARNPFKQDEELFDYEVDSDDEWEEEEPGESVSSDEEEEETEKGEDEEDADGWMVPHGYLSDGEGIEDDEEGDNVNKQDLQKVRQAAWESELKRQAKPLKLTYIGPVWQDNTAAIAAQQLEILLKYKAVCLNVTEGPIPTSFSGARSADDDTSKADRSEERQQKSLKRSVPEEAMPDLIRLLHGNPCGIKKLIKEFRMFWKLKTSPEPEKSASETEQLGTSLIDESMEVDSGEKNPSETQGSPKEPTNNDFAMSKRQLELKIPAIAVREKREKKTLWYVHDSVLKQYSMEDLKLPNSWEYVCVKVPVAAKEKATPKAEESVAKAATSGRATPNIMQFAQPMSPSMIQAIGSPSITGKDKEAVASPLASTPAPPVKPVKTIKELFSKKIGPAQNEIKLVTSPISGNSESKTISPTSSKSEVSTMTPLVNGLLKVKPVPKPAVKSSPTVSQRKEGSAIASTSKQVEVTPKGKQNRSVIETVLTSPELMQVSPKSSLKPEVQPMEMDVIVID